MIRDAIADAHVDFQLQTFPSLAAGRPWPARQQPRCRRYKLPSLFRPEQYGLDGLQQVGWGKRFGQKSARPSFNGLLARELVGISSSKNGGPVFARTPTAQSQSR